MRLSAKKGHVLFSQKVYLNGFEDKSQTRFGCLEIDPDAFDTPELALEEAQKLTWKFVGEADASGFTEIVQA